MKRKIIFISLVVVLCACIGGIFLLKGNKAPQNTVQKTIDMPAIPEIKAYEDFEKTAPNFIDVSSTEELKKLFAGNELTSRIMTLHNDVNDIMYGCRCVYDEGKKHNLDLSLFYKNMDKVFAGIVSERSYEA